MKALLGALLGGLGGYWIRPSIPLLGQLPFSTVITRGGDLRGLDLLVKGVAEQSFNYVLIGAVLGGLAGLVVAHIGSTPRREGP